MCDPDKPDCIKVENLGTNIHPMMPSQDQITRMDTLIVSRKINFYATNHHTDQGNLADYVLRVFYTHFRIYIDKTTIPDAKICSAIHSRTSGSNTYHLKKN